MANYPIIQAPMAGGIVNPEMVAKVSNSGCLGFIPAGYLTPDELEDFIKDTRRLTKNKFGVNLFIEHEHYSQHQFKSKAVIDLEKVLGIHNSNYVEFPKQHPESDYINVILKNKIDLVSCTFGVFNNDTMTRLRANNVQVLATTTCIAEIEFSLLKKVNGIILQGTEAGGHQSTFLSESENLTPTMELLKIVRSKYPNLLLIATGGINSYNFKEYLSQGANYVQIGSEFMLTNEASTPDCYKEYILSNPETALTRSITGRYARGCINELMQTLDKSRQILDFPLQHYATTTIRKYGKTSNNPQYLSLWAGQNIKNCKMQPIDDLLATLISNLSN